jgi:tetratricopeptide (TPR) repeat protein
MVHMPSHIDVRLGRWEEAIASNRAAMAADAHYLEHATRPGFYRVYMAHNHHMLTYAAMMTGRGALALATIRAMVDSIPADWLRENAAVADGFMAMPLEVQVRFGRWQEILDAPDFPGHLPLARALRHHARGVARAARGEAAEARHEQRAFLAARAQVPPEAFFGNNTAADLLGVAEELLGGEILLREGRTEAGLAALRQAVRREDRLRYDEPPDWILPVRHALGAALLQHGRLAEAEQVYRDDLARLPGNGWSLFGLGRALRLQGRDAEAAEVEARFREAWREADLELRSSCLCQPGV